VVSEALANPDKGCSAMDAESGKPSILNEK